MAAQGRSADAETAAADVEWLHLLVADGQLLADLAFADIVLWVPTASGQLHRGRPLAALDSAATLFYRDFVGQEIKPEWRAAGDAGLRDRADRRHRRARLVRGDPDAGARRAGAAPAGAERVRDHRAPDRGVTRHSNLSEARTPSRQELTFNQCANDLFAMIASGDFPDLGAPSGPRRGAPRASDGLIRLDVDGIVTFASPNGLSAFNRMGFAGELEGESLAEVTTDLLAGKLDRRRVAAARGHRAGAVAHRHRGARRHGHAAHHPDPAPRRAGRRDRAGARHDRGAPSGAGAHHQGRDDPRDPPPGQEQPADGRLAAAHPGAAHPQRGRAGRPHPGHAAGRRHRGGARHPESRASTRTSTSTTSSTGC